VDPFYLTWKAREYGVATRFIELAGEVNAAMPEWIVRKVSDALNERGRSLKGSKILVVGVAYKKNVDDTRESPALEIMELLLAKGADVSYFDPNVPRLRRTRKHAFQLSSVEGTDEELVHQDAVVLVTDHDAIDYERLSRLAPLVVDTRNAFRKRNLPFRGILA
jgi:UDP-N-acetyl-D-glucosamine dehydrogenase